MKKLGKADMIKILKNYGITDYLSHEFVDAKNSLIYHLITESGEYILKSPKNHKIRPKEIEYEYEIVNYLSKKSVNVQRVMKTLDNKLIVKYEGLDYALLTYIKGEELENDYVKESYLDTAKNIGLMHKALLELKIRNIGYSHASVSEFKKEGVLPFFSDSDKIEYKNLLKELKSINYKKLRKCVIHSDLTEINAMQFNNKFSGFIDFATAYKDYLVIDLAYYIANCIIKPEWIKDFFSQYNNYVKLNKDEKEALYYLIKMKLMQKKHLIKEYNNFSTLSKKEFIKLIS